MTGPVFAPEIQRALTHANDAMNAAARRGWPLPDGYTTATAILDAANVATIAPAPVLGELLKDPAGVAAFVKKAGTERLAWSAGREVAAELAATARLAVIRAARAAGPGYLDRLCDLFDELAADLAALLDIAPRDVTGYETPEQLRDHAALRRCVVDLTLAAADRGTFALLTDEAADLGSTGAFWLLVDPRPDTSLQAIGSIAAAIQGRVPAGLDEWVQLQLLGMRMAALGEAGSRLSAYNRAQEAGRNRLDGGMADRTWSQALADAEPPPGPMTRRPGACYLERSPGRCPVKLTADSRALKPYLVTATDIVLVTADSRPW